MERLIVLGLGSNMGDKKAYLNKACIALESFFNSELIKSSIYETDPVGFESDSQFLNQCVCFNSNLSAAKILNKVMEIEKELGRKRIQSDQKVYNSRTIDIDILFIGDEVYDKNDLVVPHPRLHERNFVLVPLSEIAPNLIHPTRYMRVLDLLKSSSDENILKKNTP